MALPTFLSREWKLVQGNRPMSHSTPNMKHVHGFGAVASVAFSAAESEGKSPGKAEGVKLESLNWSRIGQCLESLHPWLEADGHRTNLIMRPSLRDDEKAESRVRWCVLCVCLQRSARVSRGRRNQTVVSILVKAALSRAEPSPARPPILSHALGLNLHPMPLQKDGKVNQGRDDSRRHMSSVRPIQSGRWCPASRRF
jgi:hypothetical protein